MQVTDKPFHSLMIIDVGAENHWDERLSVRRHVYPLSTAITLACLGSMQIAAWVSKTVLCVRTCDATQKKVGQVVFFFHFLHVAHKTLIQTLMD